MNEQYNRLAIEAAGVTIDELNSILEFQVNNNYDIIVKQCNHVTKDKQNNKGYRQGRFNMDPVEHRQLQACNGLYLFIVHHDKLFSEMRLLQATTFTYSKLIAWPTVWFWTKPDNLEGDLFMWCDKVPNFILDEEDHKHGL